MDTKRRLLKPFDSALVYIEAIGANIALQLIIGVLMLIFSFITDIDIALNYVFMFLMQIVFFCIVFFNLRYKKAYLSYDPVSDTAKAPLSKRTFNIFLGIISAVICVACFIGIANAFDILLRKIGFSGAELPMDTALQTVLVVIATVLLAPIGEELIFRGALLTGLKQCYGTLISVLLSGLAFSLMHMNPEQTVYQFCLGCACAYLTIRSKSILTAIALHSANNLIAVLLIKQTALGEGVDFIAQKISNNLLLCFGVIAGLFIVGVITIFFIGKLLAHINKTQFKTKEAYAVKKETLSSQNGNMVNVGANKRFDEDDDIKKVRWAKYLIIAGFIVCAVVWFFVLLNGILTNILKV